ncbi:CinA family protein [Aliiroseovarius crassostreae]|uniref:CinA family protein n=1 Tax=Aliiroseovarius crassostreae TaxID=154981 RepID=UPI00220E7919|nr:CinA family protein [Aliiroseovarius crassostreae]UWQ12258.1 CinA family protein [Aliiroseovarius crassostreae]
MPTPTTLLTGDPFVAGLLDMCRRKGVKLATAESCTGGMVGCWVTEIPGSSDVFDRGFITYSNDAKQEMLGVQAKTLAAHGAVSEEVAAEMALGALAHSAADMAVSITGIAGPGGSDHKPEGRVCFGLAEATGGTPAVTTETVEFGARGRDQVRLAAARHALELIDAALSAR